MEPVFIRPYRIACTSVNGRAAFHENAMDVNHINTLMLHHPSYNTHSCQLPRLECVHYATSLLLKRCPHFPLGGGADLVPLIKLFYAITMKR